MSSRTPDLRLRLFTGVVLALALLCLGLTARVYRIQYSAVLLAFAAVAIIAGALTVRLPSVIVSITAAVSSAAVLLLGPAAGALVSGLSAIPVAAMADEKRFTRGLFNFGQLALADLLGGWAYLLAGGRLLEGSPLHSWEIPQMILPLTFLAMASFLTNTLLVGAVVSIASGLPFRRVWRSSFGWTIPAQMALTVLAVALAQIVASEGIVGLGLFVVPLFIARQFYERYTNLRVAYADTVRSLIAVIEAKDAYTKGHSERVAIYAVDIARRMGFDDRRIERMELAALLHDLGKVGISKGILAKKGRLTDEEFEEIKRHPRIGAAIIESVPFLSDLTPFISAHHERIDGKGYGDQLAAEQIPVEARILSVADSFDAMTSSRPYRSPRSVSESLLELRRCAGLQFDEVIVEVFAQAVQSGAFAEVLPEAELADEAI